jgi:hypothetical protein
MTAVSAAEAAEAQIHVGWVVNASLKVISRRWLDLVLLALPFVALPQLLGGLLPPDQALLRPFAGIPSVVFIGGAVLITHNELAGRDRMSFAQLLRAGFRRFVTLWLISAIKTVAVGLGLVVGIVPGVVLLVAWMPAAAIAVVEDCGSTQALVEAWTLTRGSRWRLAALLCVQAAAVAVILLGFVIVATVLYLTLGVDDAKTVAALALDPILAIALQFVFAVPPAAAYVALKIARYGSVEVVDQVFA